MDYVPSGIAFLINSATAVAGWKAGKYLAANGHTVAGGLCKGIGILGGVFAVANIGGVAACIIEDLQWQREQRRRAKAQADATEALVEEASILAAAKPTVILRQSGEVH